MGILLGKKFKENVEFFSQDNSDRILRSTLKINDSTFYISNIYASNNGKERKSFFNAINDTLFKYTDDSDNNYSLILGDFNCAIQKNLDRNPPQQLYDISVREFQSMLHRNDLFDVWRKLNSETKRYTFKRGKSKSRIDYILCSNAVGSKVFGTRINHFPFSDHDIIITKLKTEDINRGPGMWIMNLETIKSEQFRHAFKIWWDNWKIEKNKYNDIREWWDLAKNKIKLLTMEISRNLKCKQNKKEIDRLERKLGKLKLIANETDEINAQIKQSEGLIKNYYNKKKNRSNEN